MPVRNRLARSLPTILAASLPLLAASACSSRSPDTAAAVAAVSTSSRPGTCKLALSLDGGDGRFNGMSHSGTMLILRNAGKAPCTIPARPLPRFTDNERRPLNIVMQTPVGMHPGPVLLPVVVLPGTSVTSDLRWVSGNVYDHGHCESPTFITLMIGKEAVSSAFSGQLCGAGGKPSSYSMTAFQAATTHS